MRAAKLILNEFLYMKKHLQKYLFEEKVCNLVTEISSKETGGIPGPNTDVILKRKTA